MKKRAALCIRGAVSKKTSRYTYNDSLYTNKNDYIKYTSVYKSIKKHIIDVNNDYETDVFIHSWSTDIKEDLITLYNPKQHLFEDNQIYSCEIESKCDVPSDYGGISKALSIKKVLEYLESKKSNIILYTYDSILIDYSKEDGKETLKNIKNILESGFGFKVNASYGTDYNNLTKI
jgi:hypothetical protein